MTRKYIYEFTVSGKGRFPIDMLRYDMAIPVTAVSAGKIEDTFSNPREKHTIRLWTEKRFGPTVERWESFGWRVLVTQEMAATA